MIQGVLSELVCIWPEISDLLSEWCYSLFQQFKWTISVFVVLAPVIERWDSSIQWMNIIFEDNDIYC